MYHFFDSALYSEQLQLIDLELSGSNYRGFDLMKLFRANREIFSVCFWKFFLRKVFYF